MHAAAFVWTTAPTRDETALVDATAETFDAFDVRPTRLLVSTHGKAKVASTTYSAARFAKSVRDPDTTRLVVMGDTEAKLHLKFHVHEPEPSLVYVPRSTSIIAPMVPPDDPRLAGFLAAMCLAYPVLHGGVHGAPDVDLAAMESSLVLFASADREREERIIFDSTQRDVTDRLRRLYPVTIIGPAIWASLPPLPAVDPPLVVRDLADCKMVTAWPTLVDPHDLAFLLGTRALRRWLWPHTIQNPADDLATIDARLKWAELLPW